MGITSVENLVAQANALVDTLSPNGAMGMHKEGNGVLVDIRDIRELGREGKVKGAVHAPRGMLEFWFDPQCIYHRDVFAQREKTYILFCAAGWRSALAARSLVEMGFTNIAHVDGGFGALKDAGAPIIEPQSK